MCGIVLRSQEGPSTGNWLDDPLRQPQPRNKPRRPHRCLAGGIAGSQDPEFVINDAQRTRAHCLVVFFVTVTLETKVPDDLDNGGRHCTRGVLLTRGFESPCPTGAKENLSVIPGQRTRISLVRPPRTKQGSPISYSASLILLDKKRNPSRLLCIASETPPPRHALSWISLLSLPRPRSDRHQHRQEAPQSM